MEGNDQYTWNARDYAGNSTAQQAWARELISKLNLQGDENLLDIGCGDGKVTAEISGHLPRGNVLGIDSSNDMIELASANFTKNNYPNLAFQTADAMNLSFKEEFDVVFSNAALHWVKDHAPVLSGINKSLKPKGRIILQMGGKGNAESILSVLDDVMSENEWSRYFIHFEFPYGFYDVEEYKGWLENAGLEPVRLELIPKVMSYDDKDGLAGWIRTTLLPYTIRVPSDQMEEFINQIYERYVEKFPLDKEGNVNVNMVRLEVEAIKG